MYRKYVKRWLDIILAGVIMMVLLPLYIILAIYVAVFMGFPILFGQERIGKDEIPFTLYKFRSMTNKKDKHGNLLPENKRLTLAGRLLRTSSLDELPELWSIFIGKMSFVGPRPMPTYYMPYYYPEERKKHKVRGGLIPPDSLTLKPMVTYEEQFKYEVDYAENVSFWLDTKIIIYTFVILFKRFTDNYGGEFRPHLNVARAQLFDFDNKKKKNNEE